MTQRAIAEMLKQGGGGHVVNITTTLADYANSSVPSVLAALTKGGLAPESYHALAGLHPLQRVGQVSDIVDGILFLESSPFITGEILHIDGGQIAGH